MEVNLVFSNHPETRKEVLHFYDYSSREYMLPILHAGDSMLQVLIEPVSLVRDRVLETLRLMASELKSQFHQSRISNLHYGLYHILLRLSRGFLFFCSLGFTANHTSYLFGLSFDTETGIHLLSDPGGARCQNRTALLVPKTRVLPLHFILHITSPESESNRQPQIKCPPCTKRRPIVTMALYH